MQNQTNLELKAISKRTKDSNLNDEKLFGVTDNQVKGHSINDEYDINGEDNKKGGDGLGSITDHLHSFDFTTGGDKVDVKEREKQLGYTINGINKYTSVEPYSTADVGSSEDTSYKNFSTELNIGQVVIY